MTPTTFARRLAPAIPALVALAVGALLLVARVAHLGPARVRGTAAHDTIPVRIVPTIAPPSAPPGKRGDGDIVEEVHVPSDAGDVGSLADVGGRAGFEVLVPSYVPPGLGRPVVHFENSNGDERLRDLVSATWHGTDGSSLDLTESRSRVYPERGEVEADSRNQFVKVTPLTVNGANGYKEVGHFSDGTLVLVVLYRDGLRIEVLGERLPEAEVDRFVASL
ncbi:MAG TPA: hypothetical protein VFQ85_18860 [Mycobacteriales bacterium]|jgi:hypothetical protein|nr:hypothetical protein [Mycobacteriales bacterium]